MLWATAQEAEDAVHTIDAGACGGACRRDHRAVALAPFITSTDRRAAA
jgi:hypothetical protein